MTTEWERDYFAAYREQRKRPAVLLIDDDVELCEIFTHCLVDCEWILAHSADDGLQKLTERPDVSLVLLDVHLPGKSGLELLPWIQQETNARVVVITGGEVTPDIFASCHGALAVLQKPFNMTGQFLKSLRLWAGLKPK